MQLASTTIQQGRNARFFGKPLESNPCRTPDVLYETHETPAGKIKVKVNLDWKNLWEVGWNIENKIQERKS